LLAWKRWALRKQEYSWRRTERILPGVQPAGPEQRSGKPV